MANVVITKQLGYIKIDFGDYFPESTLEKTHYFPKSGWQGVCTQRVLGLLGAYEDGIEFHASHEQESFKLCYNEGLDNFMQVDSVEGVVPEDNDHLIELIINLIQ